MHVSFDLNGVAWRGHNDVRLQIAGAGSFDVTSPDVDSNMGDARGHDRYHQKLWLICETNGTRLDDQLQILRMMTYDQTGLWKLNICQYGNSYHLCIRYPTRRNRLAPALRKLHIFPRFWSMRISWMGDKRTLYDMIRLYQSAPCCRWRCLFSREADIVLGVNRHRLPVRIPWGV